MNNKLLEKIKLLRKYLNININEMSKKIGITKEVYEQFENGNIELEDKHMLKCLDELGIDDIYQKYVNIKEENNNLKNVEFINDEYFNFAEVVDQLAKRKPNKLALLHVDSNDKERKFTFKDIDDLSSKAANYFKDLGIKKGDRVMIVLKSAYQVWYILLALHKVGAVVVPATHMLRKTDYEYRFDQANISSIIALNNNDIIGEIESCYNKDKLKNKISVNGSCNDWKNFDKEIEKYSTSFEIEKTSKDDPMILFFTSGTTSYPKGVIHSFSYPLAHIITAKYWHNVSKDGLHYTLSDTGWAKFFWGKIYGQWLCEAPIFAYDYDGRFIAEDVLDKISKYQITSLCAPATNYRMFNTADLSKYDLSCVKNFLVAGEPFEADSYNKFCDAVSNEIRAAYGMTETTMLSGNLVNMKNKPGTIGKINPIYDYMIVDSNGNIVDDNNIGELLIRPKNGNIGILKGYLKNKEIISPINNGWFNTGDSVFKDDDGYLNFIGRKDDIIKTSGYKVAPPEVEELIMELPFVKECVVIGLPDKIRGAIVSALVVLNDNIKELDDLKVKIQKYIKSKTSPYKYPRKIFFVSEIPKTISGKMDKGKIKKLLLTNAYKIDKKND